MESPVPTGAAYLFPEKPANNKRYHNAHKDVEQELLHKATSFTENRPAVLIAYRPALSIWHAGIAAEYLQEIG
jgi:hypothetical protein